MTRVNLSSDVPRVTLGSRSTSDLWSCPLHARADSARWWDRCPCDSNVLSRQNQRWSVAARSSWSVWIWSLDCTPHRGWEWRRADSRAVLAQTLGSSILFLNWPTHAWIRSDSHKTTQFAHLRYHRVYLNVCKHGRSVPCHRERNNSLLRLQTNCACTNHELCSPSWCGSG